MMPMLRSFLAGAALGALIDGWTMLPLADSAKLGREYLLLTVAGTLLCALTYALLAGAVLRVLPFAKTRERLAESGAFLPGFVFGAIPMLLGFVPEAQRMPIIGLPTLVGLVLWTLPSTLLLLAPLRLPKAVFGPRAHFASLCLVAAPVVWVVAYFQASAVPPGFANGGAYPDAKRVENLLKKGPQAEAIPGSPDLVLVSIDTLRTDLRRGGQSVLPYLEELHADGLWSAQGYSTSNQTVPAHVGMLTGFAPEQHLVGQNPHILQIPYGNLLALRLHASGYQTAGVISNAMAEPFGPGYEAWDNTRARYGKRFFFMRSAGRTTWLARVINPRRAQNFIAEWLEVRPNDLLPAGMSVYATDQALAYHAALSDNEARPLHLFVHYMDAHSPYTPRESSAGTFTEGEQLPQQYRRWNDDHRTLINKVRNALDQADEKGKNDTDALAAAKLMHAWYDEEVLGVDGDLRRLVAGIREKGRPTLLIITSDHGEHFGEHGLMEHSNSLYQELVRVPFVMLGLNGFEAPKGELPGPPSVIDVAPTFYSAANLKYQQTGAKALSGANLLDPSAHGQLSDRLLTMAWTSAVEGNLFAAVSNEIKLLVEIVAATEEGFAPTITEIAVYDLATDPKESRNLLDASTLPAEIDVLRARVAEAAAMWLDVGYFRDRSEFKMPPETEAMMAELGYLDLFK
jgi:arylsulfatase A-like enzyme